MIIICKPDATEEDIQHIIQKAEKLGLRVNISKGVERTVLGFIGPEDVLRVIPLEVFPGVDQVLPVLAPYKLVSREFQKENSVIQIKDDVRIGGEKIAVIAGP
ncbi:MAG TPA: 3-deoxy-7-phosphoheptulonate synthase, partial [Candidatus Omnitrophota bacterium]|nr:3-deoxy-7-phosphoheptulonate synthase [Candidatus Omnitrophota bacterium]